MNKYGIVIHGGGSQQTPFILQHKTEIEKGLNQAVQHGFQILKKGGSALKAVEETIMLLEDHPLFNAGKGSALNAEGEVEMDAAIMDGKLVKAGAVSVVTNVKNPIRLAKTILKKTNHVILSGYGALRFAELSKIPLEPKSYFITQYQHNEFLKAHKKDNFQTMIKKKHYGTVGAVALDKKGNLAAGTSTGGTSHCLPGRIGDSCIVGAGCYANNSTCAVSGTGQGEVLINNVIAHNIAMLIELKKRNIQNACDYVILKKPRQFDGDIGVISIDPFGNIGISFNCDVMKRAWMLSDGSHDVKIY